jgi:hypothetical protein
VRPYPELVHEVLEQHLDEDAQRRRRVLLRETVTLTRPSAPHHGSASNASRCA